LSKSFCHLHNHTSYSALDGAAKIDDLVLAAKADGQNALGITDHGVLWGLVDFYKACNKHGVKPILGMESYFADDRFSKALAKAAAARGSIASDLGETAPVPKNSDIDGSDKRYYHLTILAQDNTGYSNLIKLSSDAFLEGFYHKPRADWDLLSDYSDGLIATSGCLGGPVLQELMHGRFDQALDKAARLQDIVGKDNFFIELQNHGLVEQVKTNPQLIDIARRIGAPLLATNDLHYVSHGDHVGHDALLCCQTGSKLSDENRFRFQSDQHYLKTSAEMRSLFMEVPDACDNTLAIAERCNVSIDFNTLHLPVFDVPDGLTATEYLTRLALEGLEARYGNPSDDHYARLSYELSVIDSMGLSSYFLIVWDLQKFADRQGIRRGPARGSAAGSIVSYCLDITKVDPLRHGLIFERFLNPGRIALPDIDLDYDSRYREHMINYVVEKYGSAHVAQIITFNIIRARAAVRDAARVLGYAPSFADKISKAMPPLVMGENTPLEACFEYSERYDIGYHNAAGLRDMYENNTDVKRVVDVAKSLEGLVRQDGIHAAGIVITPDPVTDYVPVQRRGNGPVVTQYEKGAVEDLGLLKMDFLGLRTLDVISDCVELIGFDPVTESSDFDDLKTFDLLKSGNTIGVFQLESLPMRKLLKRLQPNSIDDIAAVVALYRPGPMAENMHNDYADRKNGRQPVTYFHEDAEPILRQTLGLCIYQESVLEIAKKFAGYSLTEADLLRKVMGKKLVDKMAEERSKFTDGCVVNGYDEAFASKLFDMIEAFSRYSFNSSHAYSYAYLSYYTAFLKANYPKEFMAALCGSMIEDIERCGFYLNEAKDMGLTVYSPDVNRSSTFFTVEDDGIRMGLASIRNVGEGWADSVLAERKANGAFSGLTDFVNRVEPNSRSFMFLSYSGALDSFGTRLGVSTAIPEILKLHRKRKKKLESGQESLFEVPDNFDVSDVEFSTIELLNNEYEALGLYVSGHPLDAHVNEITDHLIVDFGSFPEGQNLSVLVLVNDVKVKQTKAGQRMAVLSVQDRTGFAECVVFPKKMSSVDGTVVSGDIGVLSLRVGSDFNDQKNFVFEGFSKVGSSVVEESDVADFKIFLPQGFAGNDDSVAALKRLLSSHYGWTPVSLHLSKSTVLKLPRSFSVSLNDDLISSIRVLFKEYSR
jgi:DNA polymerase-3 subunit alpha